MKIDRYLQFLERLLTPGRYGHSIGVMRVMEDLAPVYSLDLSRAMTAGLLHDAAKDLEPEKLVEIAKEAEVEIQHSCEWNPLYLHGPVSAYLVSRDLDIKDTLVLSVISMHTYCGYGKNFNTKLSWCLRFADFLEPTREWQGENKLRMKKLEEIVFSSDMERGALHLTDCFVGWLEENGMPVHPNMRKISAMKGFTNWIESGL